jgi:hypothetical protein
MMNKGEEWRWLPERKKEKKEQRGLAAAAAAAKGEIRAAETRRDGWDSKNVTRRGEETGNI